MKSVSASVRRGIQTGTFCVCADNSGADMVQIIAVRTYKGVKRRRPECGVADIVVAAVKKGDQKIKHEVVQACVVRQKKEFRRPSGIRVKFEDNAVVLVNEKFEPRGTAIKGPIAKEVVERFSALGKIASTVV